MRHFEEEDYRVYAKERLKGLPREGRGQMRRMALAMGVHTSLVSQVLSGKKNFSPEQALECATFLGLSALETEFLLALVERERAGTPKLRTLVQGRLEQIRGRARELDQRLPQERSLSDSERAYFYSNWAISAVRLLCSLAPYAQPIKIAERLGISAERVAEYLEFLRKSGLVDFDGKRYQLGPSRTHLGSSDPLVAQHHRNWRMRAVQKHEALTKEELSFSAPLTLSKSDFETFRKRILSLIDELSDTVQSTEAEDLAVLNLDWFWA